MNRQLSVLVRAAAIGASALLATAHGDELDPPSIATADSTSTAGTVSTSDVLRPIERTFMATHPLFLYRFTKADGMLTAPGTPQSTSMHYVSVRLNWNLGQYVTVRYVPGWTYYSNSAFDKHVDHEVTIRAQLSYHDWYFRGYHRYSRASATLIETGRQTTQDINTTTVEAQRPLGQRTTLELGLAQDARSADNFSDHLGWSTNNWLHYQLSDALMASAGFSYGYVRVEDSADMSYEALRTRIRWHFTDKIQVDVRAGLENRAFRDTDLPDTRTPIYGANIVYQILETTSLSITGDRTVAPSLFESQVMRTTNWRFGLNQRLLERFNLTIAVVRRTSTYDSADDIAIPSRRDSGRLFQARLGTHFHTNGTIALVYANRKNSSTDTRFGFSGDQYGVELSYRY